MNAIKIGFVALFVSSFSAAFAQLSVGAKGGASLTKTTGNGLAQGITGQLNYILSGNGGVFLEMPVFNKFTFRPEVGYLQTGAGVNLGTSFGVAGVDMSVGAVVRERLTYIQAAPMLKYELGDEANTVKPYLILGPTLNYLADAKLVSRADLVVFRTQAYRVDLPTSAFNRFQVGGAVGSGLNFDLGNTKLFVEGRYERGFTRVYNTPVVQLPVHNQSFSLMVGFSMPL